MHFPFGSESNGYLGNFIVQCVPDLELSELRAGFQPTDQCAPVKRPERSAKRLRHVGVVACGSGDRTVRTGTAANRQGSGGGRSRWRAKGAGFVATAATGARPSSPPGGGVSTQNSNG